MDLSSLEGPPIPDTRFTVQTSIPTPSIASIPSIHIDIAIDTDTRPSTSDAFSRLNHKYNNYYNQNTDMDTDMPMAAGRGRSRNDNSRPTLLGEPWAETETRPRAVSNPPSLCRGGHHQQTNRLVWLERERMWIVRPANTTTGTDTSKGRTSYSRSTSHLPLPTSFYDLGMGIDDDGDSPPAYGNHYEDRILASRPMASDRGQTQGRGAGLSRWGAIARRLNRS